MLKKGTQIVYMPYHVSNDTTHSDCEFGFVTSVKDTTVFCRFWSAFELGDLRNKSNSEGIDRTFIKEHMTTSQAKVDKMIEKYNI